MNIDYSQFYRGTANIPSYGKGYCATYGERIPMSRLRRKEVMQRLADYRRDML